MNNKKTYSLVLLVLFFLVIGCTKSDDSEKIEIKKADIISQTLGVDGMTCMGCEITLEKNVSEIIGVIKVKASSDDKTMVVQYDKTKTNLPQIIKVVQKAGYIPLDLIEDGQ